MLDKVTTLLSQMQFKLLTQAMEPMNLSSAIRKNDCIYYRTYPKVHYS
ncbi:hypothetical protein [Pseudoalteromonas sp.]